jgi:serine/threonine-protein kinase
MGTVVETRKTAGVALVDDTDLSVSEDSFLRELARAPDREPVPAAAAANGATPAPPTLAPGALVAERFRLERSLGEGGMGVVWQAVHTVTRKPVALKFLKPGKVGHDLHAVRRFMREARAACAVRHPSVVEIHDVLELADGSPVMVMELLAGETLAQRIAREQFVPLGDLARIMVHVCSAVGCAHALGIVHRDLKPENIFLARSVDGQVTTKVLDFGIAKLTAHEGNAARTAATTGSQTILGTPFYMAPEQLFGERDVDHRADIWALGVILYEALSGTRPTDAENMGQIYKIVVTGGVVPLRTRAPHVPPPILDLVARMMTRERTARPADLGEVAAILAEYTDETFRPVDAPKAPPAADRETPAPVEAHAASAPPRATAARPSRRLWIVGLAAALAMAAIGGVVAFSGASRTAPSPSAATVPKAIEALPQATAVEAHEGPTVATATAEGATAPSPATGGEAGAGVRESRPDAPARTTTQAAAPTLATSKPKTARPLTPATDVAPAAPASSAARAQPAPSLRPSASPVAAPAPAPPSAAAPSDPASYQ